MKYSLIKKAISPLALSVLLAGCAENATNKEHVAQDISAPVPLRLVSDVSWDDFHPYGCEIERPNVNEIKIRLTGTSCTLMMSSDKLSLLKPDQWLSFVRHGDGPSVLGTTMLFWNKSNQTRSPDLTLSDGLFPNLEARRAFPLKLLKEGRGIPKTPGSLIGFAFGRGVHLDEWNKMGVNISNYFGGPTRTVTLSEFKITDAEPDYPVGNTKMLDSIGQWKQRDFKDKISDLESMKEYLIGEAAKDVPPRESQTLSQYGGIKAKRFESNGFFQTKHDGERWYLVDPEGYAFYSIGIDIIGAGIGGNIDGIESLHDWLPPQDDKTFEKAWIQADYLQDIRSETGMGSANLFDFGTANLIRTFGKDWHEQWSKITARRLIEWNVNTVGNWSDMDFARSAKTPYVMPMEDFPVTNKRIFRDFPDVFSPEYAQKAKVFAKQLEEFKNDKYLIGYFMNNEPGWAYVPQLNIAEELLSQGEGFVSKTVLINFLSERYKQDISAFNRAWALELGAFSDLHQPRRRASELSAQAKADLTEFSTRMLDEYVRVPVAATKAVDPNHLNMGMRWASSALKHKWRFAGSQYLDVFSMNNYTDDPTARLDIAAEMSGGKPVLIGEFHHGSMEGGHPSYGARWTATEAERAQAYRYYAENAVSHKNSIGLHYFAYNDDPVLGRFDGENFHHGFVTTAHKPYSDFIKGYTEVNKDLYDVLLGKKEKSPKYKDGMVSSYPMTF